MDTALQYQLQTRSQRLQRSCKAAVPSQQLCVPLQHRRWSPRCTQRRRVTTMGLFGLGLPEVAVVAGIAVLVFGPSKLPELGKELGKTVKSFQTAAKEFETELKNATEDTTDAVEDAKDKVKDESRKL